MTIYDSWPATGFIRLPQILAPLGPIPVSRSTWWAGVASGRYPQPVKLGPRITAWRVDDIKALIERGVVSGDQQGCCPIPACGAWTHCMQPSENADPARSKRKGERQR
jgi:prophage regulatory protein